MEREYLDFIRINNDLIDVIILDLVFHGIPRQVYIRNDHFNSMPDMHFFNHFRLRKETVLQLLPRLEPRLEYIHNLNNSVSPINQLLICLRYYATGCHQLSLAHFGNVHKSTVNIIIKRVTEAICHLANEHIALPTTAEEIRNTQVAFFQKASFPRVLAAIDCTHIKIISPGGGDAEVYRNRKGYFSLNVQAAVNSNYKFIDIVSRWPGSVHDSTIFNNSMLRARFERNEYPNCFLLGDSGYAIRSYLMTPLLDTPTIAEQRYNESQIRTRVIVENTFGIWKRRFPILAYGCRTNINLTMIIVVATAILHNIARDSGEEDPANENAELLEEYIRHGDIAVEPNINNNTAFRVRSELIRYFSQL